MKCELFVNFLRTHLRGFLFGIFEESFLILCQKLLINLFVTFKNLNYEDCEIYSLIVLYIGNHKLYE